MASTDATEPPQPGTLKKSRRTTAIYPNLQNKPSNPFSRSAAKRQSVMALGSIEHLQHYFTKTGLAAKRKGNQVKGLVPALGPSIIPTLEISAVSPTRTSFDLPPLPASLPTVDRAPYPQVDRVYPQTDPQHLKPGLIRDLEETEKAWGIAPDVPPPKGSSPQMLTAANVKKSTDDFFDVLSVLQTTTKTIRSVRNYIVSLPDDHTRPTAAQPERVGSSLRHPATPTTKWNSPTSTLSVPPPPVPFPSTPEAPDPHARIRKAALEVLAMLRLLEESSRIPLSDDAYDSLSVGSGNGDIPLSVSDEFLSTSAGHTSPRSGSSTVMSDRLFSEPEDDNDSATSASMSHAGSSKAGNASRIKPGVATFVPLKNGQMVQVWADEDEPLDLNTDPDSPRHGGDAWDQRLVLGGGWLYKQVPMSERAEQKAVVANYLNIVDELLFEGPHATTASPPTSGRSSPAGPPEDTQYRRGWLRVKASLPTTSRIRKSRSSIGPHSPPQSESSGPSFTGSGLKRVSSSGMLAPVDMFSTEPDPLDDDDGGLEDLLEGDEDEELEFEDDELPDWARRDKYVGDWHARLHAILTTHLPPHLLTHLPPYSFPNADRLPLLARLSDGQLLCTGYNAIVRQSRKQWGFIGAASIHDIIGLEERERSTEGSKKVIGWTFRRAENLRLWAAALKLRYLVPLAATAAPIHQPSHPFAPPAKDSGSVFLPVSRILAAMGPPSPFDPKIIAKQEDGWETMLETALERWVENIVKERREKPSTTK